MSRVPILMSEKKKDRNDPEKSRENVNAPILPRLPVRCPLDSCQQIMGTGEIMAHCLRDHGTLEFEFREALEGEKSLMVVDMAKLKFRTNSCLGMLCYGGRNSEPGNKPVELGYNRANSFLPEEYVKYKFHLPIIIMICKTSTTCFIKDIKYREDVTDPSSEKQYVYLIWVATANSARSLNCTITAFDKFLKMSRSKIIKVRKIKDSHDPNDFAACDPNYLLLRQGEVRKLTHNFEKELNLELIIKEYQ